MTRISDELRENIENAEVIVMTEGGELCPSCATERISEVRVCINCGAPYIPNRGEGRPGRGRARLRCYACSPSKMA